MSISRRNFFRISVLPALVSLAPSISIFGQRDQVTNDRLLALHSGDFRNQIGTKFKLSDGASAVRQAVLTAVNKIEVSGAARTGVSNDYDWKCFSLNFRLVGGNRLKQATYAINHGILGEFQLFLVPGAVQSNQASLVAIINREC